MSTRSLSFFRTLPYVIVVLLVSAAVVSAQSPIDGIDARANTNDLARQLGNPDPLVRQRARRHWRVLRPRIRKRSSKVINCRKRTKKCDWHLIGHFIEWDIQTRCFEWLGNLIQDGRIKLLAICGSWRVRISFILICRSTMRRV